MTTAAVSASGAIPRAGGGMLRTIYIVWWRDVIRFWRDRVRLIASLAQPLLYLVIFGSGLSSALGGGIAAAGGVSYTQFIYPGVICMSVLFSAIFGGMSIVWDREFGFMKELLVAPIERTAVAIGKTLGSATQSLVQAAILLVLAPFVGVTFTVVSFFQLLGLMVVLAFGLSAFGVAIASRMKSMQGFQVVMNFLMMPMFFLSGALFPLIGLPLWMTVLTRLDPASYGIDPIRRTVLGSAAERTAMTIGDQVVPIGVEALVVFAFGLVMLAVAARAFQHRD
ncbi:MAG TPA: ABC transporter permease [Candidatus Limnocylindria bacterium]|nr:ABC transporter permease [Candidatus Limnocylindria bacterium]